MRATVRCQSSGTTTSAVRREGARCKWPWIGLHASMHKNTLIANASVGALCTITSTYTIDLFCCCPSCVPVDVMTAHPMNNIPEGIFEKIGRNLHLYVSWSWVVWKASSVRSNKIAHRSISCLIMCRQPNHPIWIIKNEIHKFFDAKKSCQFAKIDNLSPVVSTYSNFDEVLVPVDHVSRNPNDTYYVNADTVLRCHTSAHQASTLRAGTSAFLITGDVYRCEVCLTPRKV